MATEHELSAYQEQQSQNIRDNDLKQDINTSLYRDPNEPTIVGIQMFFSRTGELDMVQQNFFSEFDLVFEWQPTQTEVEDYKQDATNFEPSWVPIVQFKNGNIESNVIKIVGGNKGFRIIGSEEKYYAGVESTDVYGSKLSNLRYPYIIEVMYQISGHFSEFLELRHFPMDCQDLKISIQLMDSIKKAAFAPYFNKKSEVIQVSQKYNGLDEYIMEKPMCEFYTNQYSEAFCALNVILKLKRKYHIYFWKIVVYVGLICGSSLAAFTMHEREDLPDRYSLLFTLLLTLVAFQYVVSESLPQLTYLTFLDYYVLVGFIYLMIQIVGCGVIGWWELSEDVDNYFGFASIGLYISFQIGFIIYAYYARKYELRKLTFATRHYRLNNYRQYKMIEERNKGFGITTEHLEFTTQAREQLKGNVWADVQDGRD